MIDPLREALDEAAQALAAAGSRYSDNSLDVAAIRARAALNAALSAQVPEDDAELCRRLRNPSNPQQFLEDAELAADRIEGLAGKGDAT